MCKSAGTTLSSTNSGIVLPARLFDFIGTTCENSGLLTEMTPQLLPEMTALMRRIC